MLLGVLCVLSATACGRKGPPLAPIVYLPRPVADLAAKRVENEVVVQFTVPTLNTDGSGPADLRRVEVYAHTGPLPTPADYLKYGTLVSSIDIAQPPEPANADEAPGPAASDSGQAQNGENAEARPAETLRIEPTESKGERQLTEQGRLISVREPLTDKHREIGPMPPARPVPPAPANAPVVERLETPGTENFELPPMRFYTVVGVSRSRGRRGPYAGPLRVPLAEPLAPPDQVDVTYTESAISLTWPRQPEDAALPLPPASQPAAGTTSASTANTAGDPAVPAAPPVSPPIVAPVEPAAAPLGLQETEGTFELYADLETDGTQDAAPPAPAPTAAAAKIGAAARAAAAAAKAAGPPVPRFGYNVYDASAFDAPVAPDAPSPSAAPGAPAAASEPVAPIVPLNTALLTVPAFTDTRLEFGVERCYVIRRVELASGVPIESAPTPPVCVTPVDRFAPAPPRNVQAISGGAGVSLLWEANAEADVLGYLVLRGEAPGDKLSPLTPAPIAETSFNDTTVRRGRTYVYEVVAVDKETPPNQSAPSNRVEETIR